MSPRSALLLIGLSLFFMVDDLFVLYFLNNFTPLNMSRPVLTVAIIGVCIFSIIIGWMVFRAMQRKPSTGKEGLLGERGRALTPLNPSGQAFVRGEIWQAVSDDPIQEGEEIQVVKVMGLRIHVKKVDESFGR